MSDLDFDLLKMSDDELHRFAVENSKNSWTEEEQLDWAWECYYDGTLDMMCTKCTFQAIDGCYVEIDGNCPHGYKSPMLILKLV